MVTENLPDVEGVHMQAVHTPNEAFCGVSRETMTHVDSISSISVSNRLPSSLLALSIAAESDARRMENNRMLDQTIRVANSCDPAGIPFNSMSPADFVMAEYQKSRDLHNLRLQIPALSAGYPPLALSSSLASPVVIDANYLLPGTSLPLGTLPGATATAGSLVLVQPRLIYPTVPTITTSSNFLVSNLGTQQPLSAKIEPLTLVEECSNQSHCAEDSTSSNSCVQSPISDDNCILPIKLRRTTSRHRATSDELRSQIENNEISDSLKKRLKNNLSCRLSRSKKKVHMEEVKKTSFDLKKQVEGLKRECKKSRTILLQAASLLECCLNERSLDVDMKSDISNFLQGAFVEFE